VKADYIVVILVLYTYFNFKKRKFTSTHFKHAECIINAT